MRVCMILRVVGNVIDAYLEHYVHNGRNNIIHEKDASIYHQQIMSL